MSDQKWWWLSFVSDKGSEGVSIIQAVDLPTAIKKAWQLNANPGGEVAGHTINDINTVPPRYRNRHMDPVAARALAKTVR